ncbi:MAG: hypothetical protein LBG19_03810 [Prevotellaceae bacterium]|nr:hypothetical protein [Prevotellaceae bacterium]
MRGFCVLVENGKAKGFWGKSGCCLAILLIKELVVEFKLNKKQKKVDSLPIFSTFVFDFEPEWWNW